MIEVLVALVGAVGIIGAALANRGRQHAKAARDQVENSHATNFRDEFDRRHEENTRKLDTLVQWQPLHETKAAKRDARISRVEVLLVPTIAAAILNTIIHVIRKR
ncbi:MAG: hypothetical protein K0R60_1123 [Microbacterium sp.]|jgi:hypothetical protein|nr:hypothetical protein [Microbacterium sp.]